jgi:hypothetical protein
MLEYAYGFDNLRKTTIKCYLEEYFGIEVQIKVIDLEFQIISIWLDSMLSPIFET